MMSGLAWTGNGTTWTISTAGTNAVLLKMDEFQGRLNTPSARDSGQPGWIAAYNTGEGYWVVDARPPYSPVLVTTSATDYDDGVITSFQTGRGIASATWTSDGHTFIRTSDTTTGMCRHITPGSAWDLPTLVPT
jgi:dipeptidyl aminopeptidase/acylaminoacyl peptidase